MKYSFSIFFLLLSLCSSAQKIQILDSGQYTNLRGLSVVDDRVFWVCGNNGMVGRSTNGQSLQWRAVKGYESRDFRDIEAFDSSTAFIMAVGYPALILKTTDAGQKWVPVFVSDLQALDLAVMAFENRNHGICIAQPNINGRFWISESTDGGNSWQDLHPRFQPEATVQGEKLFAASGTNIQFLPGNKNFSYGFVSGGEQANLYLLNFDHSKPIMSIPLDIHRNREGSGAYSWAPNGNNWMVVGGNALRPDLEEYNHCFSKNAGKSWRTAYPSVTGLKTCVIWKNEKELIATGLNGTDVSTGGMGAWKHIDNIPFNAVQKAKNGTAIYLAGGNGRVAKFTE